MTPVPVYPGPRGTHAGNDTGVGHDTVEGSGDERVGVLEHSGEGSGQEEETLITDSDGKPSLTQLYFDY